MLHDCPKGLNLLFTQLPERSATRPVSVDHHIVAGSMQAHNRHYCYDQLRQE